jgi:hypothetical protein
MQSRTALLCFAFLAGGCATDQTRSADRVDGGDAGAGVAIDGKATGSQDRASRDGGGAVPDASGGPTQDASNATPDTSNQGSGGAPGGGGETAMGGDTTAGGSGSGDSGLPVLADGGPIDAAESDAGSVPEGGSTRPFPASCRGCIVETPCSAQRVACHQDPGCALCLGQDTLTRSCLSNPLLVSFSECFCGSFCASQCSDACQ